MSTLQTGIGTGPCHNLRHVYPHTPQVCSYSCPMYTLKPIMWIVGGTLAQSQTCLHPVASVDIACDARVQYCLVIVIKYYSHTSNWSPSDILVICGSQNINKQSWFCFLETSLFHTLLNRAGLYSKEDTSKFYFKT